MYTKTDNSRMQSYVPTSPIEFEFVIMRQHEAPQYFRPTQPHVTIGRDDGCDILLDSPIISRQHAELHLTKDGWHINDLGSSNGAYLENTRVTPKSFTYWDSQVALKIGPFTLWLQSIQESKEKGTMILLPYDSENPLTMLHESTQQSNNPLLNAAIALKRELVVDPVNITCQHDDRKSVQVTIHNHQLTMMHVDLVVSDLPETWYVLPQKRMMIEGQGVMNTVLRFDLPQSATQGEHRFSLQMYDAVTGTLRDSIKLLLTVQGASDFQFSADLEHNKRSVRLGLHNTGNAADAYRVSAQLPPGARVYATKWSSILLPGQSDELVFNLTHKMNHLIGRTRVHPIMFTIESDSAETRVVETELIVKPYIPTWVVATMTVVALAAFGIMQLL